MSSAVLSRAPIVVHPTTAHRATIIFLHGLGDSGHGWADLAQSLGREFTGAKWIFPHANVMPVTLNFGMACPAWYDIVALTRDGPEDERGLRQSRDIVHRMIDEEKKALPTSSIFVGGFSQGGAIALYSALTYRERLGGCMALSTYLTNLAKKERTDDGPAVSIFMAHGTEDPIVRYEWGTQSRDTLKQTKNVQVEWKEYRMEHTACPQEFVHMKDWLSRHMPSSQTSTQ